MVQMQIFKYLAIIIIFYYMYMKVETYLRDLFESSSTAWLYCNTTDTCIHQVFGI